MIRVVVVNSVLRPPSILRLFLHRVTLQHHQEIGPPFTDEVRDGRILTLPMSSSFKRTDTLERDRFIGETEDPFSCGCVLPDMDGAELDEPLRGVDAIGEIVQISRTGLKEAERLEARDIASDRIDRTGMEIDIFELSTPNHMRSS